MEKWKKKAVELVSKHIMGNEDGSSVVPYFPQKTEIPRLSEKYFPRVKPKAHGISSSRLYAMLSELEAEPRANVQCIAVIAGGEMVTECSAPGYSVNMPHLSHSMSKTVTGLAVGLLVDDGLLSLTDKVADLLPEYKYKSKLFAKMTVDDLLKMSSGIEFAELGSVTSDNWCEAFFESDIKYEPGTGFSYNSMNTYILSRIVCKISGKSLSVLLDERIFGPLRIKSYFWEKSNDGIEKGGWGLYLSCEDWAKLGYMLLMGGTFEGRHILSEKWVNLATSTRNISDGKLGDFDYGYQMWVGKEGSDFLFNGMFGQNVWVCPKNNLVVSVCCGNNELFQRSPTLAIIKKYLGADINDTELKTSYSALKKKKKTFFENRMPIMPKPKAKLIYRLGILHEKPITTSFLPIEGEYLFPKNNIGLLPVFVRLMQNNLASRLESLKIKCRDRFVSFVFVESGVEYEIKAGIRDYYGGVYDFRGEKYIIYAMCEEKTDIHGNPVYRLAIIFPELPNTSTVEITPCDVGLTFKFNECPDSKIVDGFIETAQMSQLAMIVMALFKRSMGDTFLADLLSLIFSPSTTAVSLKNENVDGLIAEQNDIFAALRNRYRTVFALVNRFVIDTEKPKKSKADDEVKSEKPEKNKKEKSKREKSKRTKKDSDNKLAQEADSASSPEPEVLMPDSPKPETGIGEK